MSSCICFKGFENLGNSSGDALSCSPCSHGFYSTDGDACRACPQHSNTISTGSASKSDCKCDVGYGAVLSSESSGTETSVIQCVWLVWKCVESLLNQCARVLHLISMNVHNYKTPIQIIFLPKNA